MNLLKPHLILINFFIKQKSSKLPCELFFIESFHCEPLMHFNLKLNFHSTFLLLLLLCLNAIFTVKKYLKIPNFTFFNFAGIYIFRFNISIIQQTGKTLNTAISKKKVKEKNIKRNKVVTFNIYLQMSIASRNKNSTCK